MSIFTQNREPKKKKSWFGLSHTNTLSLDMPWLTPVLCRDVIPGDRWKLSTEIFLRMMPTLSPFLTEVDVFCHYFYVPLRLVVHDYDNFFNPEEQDNVYRPWIVPADFVDLLETEFSDVWDDIPVIKEDRTTKQNLLMSYFALFAESSLADYLGIPVFSWSDFAFEKSGTPGVFYYDPAEIAGFISKIPKFSAFPFLQYQLIYDSFYRDQTLETSIFEQLESEGVDGIYKGKIDIETPFDLKTLPAYDLAMGLRTRAWKKDYFTSALPTPQAGPDVHLPMTGDAPVKIDPDMTVAQAAAAQKIIATDALSPSQDNRFLGVDGSSENGGSLGVVNDNVTVYSNGYLDPGNSLIADLSGVTSATINELRRAVRAQEFLERCARGGRRYIEMILAHFGVRSSDARLDRPEFIGGGRQPFTITEVLSHVGEDDTQNFVLGEMGGHGISYGQSSYTKRFFEEHGFIFAIVSILPKASYMQGLERMWTREDLYDYAWPSFANLGEQEIKNKELYAQGSEPEGTFGYAPRYSEYKYIPSSIHGAMRSSLSYWHLGRIFSSAPALNADFVHPRPEELKRIFAVQEQDQNSIVGVIKHHCRVQRTLPKYGIPTL